MQPRPCSVGVGWKLPGGRFADEHHLFPSLHGPAPPGALQEPVYVSGCLCSRCKLWKWLGGSAGWSERPGVTRHSDSLFCTLCALDHAILLLQAGVVYKADSWDVTLDAELGQPGASAAAATAAEGAAPLPALLGPFSGAAAVGYLGGQQVRLG